jgi:hypothetical protein
MLSQPASSLVNLHSSSSSSSSSVWGASSVVVGGGLCCWCRSLSLGGPHPPTPLLPTQSPSWLAGCVVACQLVPSVGSFCQPTHVPAAAAAAAAESLWVSSVFHGVFVVGKGGVLLVSNSLPWGPSPTHCPKHGTCANSVSRFLALVAARLCC